MFLPPGMFGRQNTRFEDNTRFENSVTLCSTHIFIRYLLTAGQIKCLGRLEQRKSTNFQGEDGLYTEIVWQDQIFLEIQSL